MEEKILLIGIILMMAALVIILAYYSYVIRKKNKAMTLTIHRLMVYREMLINKADLEEDTVDEVLAVLRAEFENED